MLCCQDAGYHEQSKDSERVTADELIHMILKRGLIIDAQSPVSSIVPRLPHAAVVPEVSSSFASLQGVSGFLSKQLDYWCGLHVHRHQCGSLVY